MFAYCANDPVNNEDPDGDVAWWVGAAVGGAAYSSAEYLLKHRRGGASWKGLGKAAAGGAITGVLFGGAGKVVSKGVRVLKSAKTAKKLAGGICFTGDTPISTKDGYKPIKEIKVGDEVYSQNPETGEKGLKKVKHVFINETDKLVNVYVDGEKIKATPEHPFWVVDEGWVEAGDLKPGDKVLLYSGKIVKIDKIEEEQLDKVIKVYNFEVEDWHTYFVSEQNVLVHNTCKMPTKLSVKGLLKNAKLPTKGKIRYVPQKGWTASQPMPKKNGGYIDRFGNIWTKGPSRTRGQDFEWDVQLSKIGKNQLGHLSRDGSHLNVSLYGRITHK